MAKKRYVYGVDVPTSVNQLNTEFIKDYLKAKLAEGAITKKQIAEYKKQKNDAIAKKEEENNKPLKQVSVSQIERKVFVELFMPELTRKASKKIDLDAELDALING